MLSKDQHETRLSSPPKRAYKPSRPIRCVAFFTIRHSDCDPIESEARDCGVAANSVTVGTGSRDGTHGTGKEFLGVQQILVDTPDAFARKQPLCKVASIRGRDGISATRTAKTRIELAASMDAHPHGSSPTNVPIFAPPLSVGAADDLFHRRGVN
jgi:hypothetical protein